MKELIPIGILVIFMGIFLVIIGSLTSAKESNTKIAVGGFIGFIPFGFASDKRMSYIIMAITCLMILLYIWFIFQK